MILNVHLRLLCRIEGFYSWQYSPDGWWIIWWEKLIMSVFQLDGARQMWLEAIQRWSVICRMWPWNLTYQKFLLCIS